VKLVVGTNRVEDNVSGLRAPQRVWLDNPDTPPPLLVRVVKLDAQSVGRCKTDDLDGRRSGHAGNGERAGGRTDNDVACCKRVGRRYHGRTALLDPGEQRRKFAPECLNGWK
jgi:hypothetical protein